MSRLLPSTQLATPNSTAKAKPEKQSSRSALDRAKLLTGLREKGSSSSLVKLNTGMHCESDKKVLSVKSPIRRRGSIMQDEDEDNESETPSKTSSERFQTEREEFYGRFQVHNRHDSAVVANMNGGCTTVSPNIKDLGLAVKLMTSTVQEKVFNGVFYNLDAMIETAHQYENEDELYEFFEVIGEGGFSVVRRALFKPTGEEIAVKILKAERETQHVIELTKQEAILLNSLDHPNIVKVKHLIQLNGKLYMGMDYLPGGSLQTHLKTIFSRKDKFSDREASQLMKGILSGVQYIHTQGIIHRDLKPQNILIQDVNDLSTVKLIDFGLGRQYKIADDNDEYCGTLTFMAPEVAKGKEYTKSVDIWALGIIMHIALAEGKHPFYRQGEDTYDSFKAKLQSIRKVEASSLLSDIAASLFHRLTTPHASSRYSAKDALKHPWITRQMNEAIPLSFTDQLNHLEQETRLKEKICLLQFMALVKVGRQNFESTDFKEYKTKCKKIARKIDRWHKKISLVKQGSFAHDEDFVMTSQSPDTFDNNSSDDENVQRSNTHNFSLKQQLSIPSDVKPQLTITRSAQPQSKGMSPKNPHRGASGGGIRGRIHHLSNSASQSQKLSHSGTRSNASGTIQGSSQKQFQPPPQMHFTATKGHYTRLRAKQYHRPQVGNSTNCEVLMSEDMKLKLEKRPTGDGLNQSMTIEEPRSVNSISQALTSLHSQEPTSRQGLKKNESMQESQIRENKSANSLRPPPIGHHVSKTFKQRPPRVGNNQIYMHRDSAQILSSMRATFSNGVTGGTPKGPSTTMQTNIMQGINYLKPTGSMGSAGIRQTTPEQEEGKRTNQESLLEAINQKKQKLGIAHSQNGSKNRIIIREKTSDSRNSHNQPSVIITRVEKHQHSVRKDTLQHSQSKKPQNYNFKPARLVSAKQRKLSSPSKK